MKIVRKFPLAFSLALCFMVPAQAEQGGRQQAFFPVGEKADAPFGFVEMCARDRALCLLGQRPEAPVRYAAASVSPLMLKASYSPEGSAPALAIPARADFADRIPQAEPPAPMLMAMIKSVNKAVNRAVVQVSDMDHMGVGEHWDRLSGDPRPVGDCEDIAIEKRARLEQAGFPARRLFYAVAFVPRFGLHTLLIARLDNGDYVLDSLSPHIVRWDQVRYVWLRQQMPGSPLDWARVDGKPRSESELYARNDDDAKRNRRNGRS